MEQQKPVNTRRTAKSKENIGEKCRGDHLPSIDLIVKKKEIKDRLLLQTEATRRNMC